MSLCRYDTSKSCENHGTSSRTCVDCILNKILTEVQALEYLDIEDGSDGYDEYIEKYEVLKIINKYRKESSKE